MSVVDPDALVTQDRPSSRSRSWNRLLVFGEVSMNEDGTSNTVYPTYPRAAEKYASLRASSPTTPRATTRCTGASTASTASRPARREDHRGTRDREAITVAEMLALIDEFLIKFRRRSRKPRPHRQPRRRQ
jgi:hypothetical protein